MRTLLTTGLLCMALAACGPKGDTGGDEPTPEASAHDHSSLAKHGGTIVELGDHTALVELLHDESAGAVMAWVMTADGGPLEADGIPILNVPAGDAPLQLEAQVRDGGYWFENAALKGHVDGIRLRISVGGKSFNPELPHAHH